MAPPTAFEKDEVDRLAIADHLNFLETELTRHAHIPLLFLEVSDYFTEAAECKSQLIGNHRNMRHHVARGTDLTTQITEYNALLAKATRLHASFHGIKMSFPDPGPPPGAAAPATSTQHIKLPPLELPKFSGNLQEWISFRDLFTTAIHNSSLTKVEKMTQLKSLLTGEAARQIRSLILSEANYDIAWKALHDRYENKRELLLSILRRLNLQPTITTASATSLRSLIDTTKECVRSLEILAIPTQHWDAMLFFILFTKMDNGSRELWEQSLPNTDIPSLSAIYEFLEQRSRALAASSAPHTRQQQQYQYQPQQHQKSHQQQNPVRAHHAETSNCPLGCSFNHYLYSCPEFQQLTPQQRQDEVKRLQRCTNCLAEGHQSFQCRSKHTCKTCNGKHNTMLHVALEGNQPDNPSSSTTQSHHIHINEKIQAGILSTAMIRVLTPNAGVLQRALLDNGSTNSFITEKAARSMNLRLQPVHIPVSGLQSVSCGHVKHVTTFQVSPHFGSSFSFKVTALVVKAISNLIPAERLKTDEYWHLHDLNLADPDFWIPGPVDVLLGTEHFWSLLQKDKLTGEDGQPIAWESSLGWLVGGPNKSSTPITSFHSNVDVSNKSIQHQAQVPVPDSSQVTVPASSQVTVPDSSQVTVPASSQVTVPASSQATVPVSSQVTFPTSSQATVPASSQVTVPASSQVTVPASSQVTVPASSQVAVPSPISVAVSAPISVSGSATTPVAVHILSRPAYVPYNHVRLQQRHLDPRTSTTVNLCRPSWWIGNSPFTSIFNIKSDHPD